MAFLTFIEIENFKSYFGTHRIGPLGRYNAVIGPNGSGKSNLMDAVSFVTGERAHNLRVKRLADLIYGASIGRPISSSARVTAIFELEDGTVKNFTRIISGAASEFLIENQVVLAEQYHAELNKLGINTKAKNFLVFQGTIEKIAVKNPKEICVLFEEMSGSGALKAEYERLEEELNTARNHLNFISNKKRELIAVKEGATKEINGGDQYRELSKKLTTMRLNFYVFKLFRCEKELKELNTLLEAKEKEKSNTEELKRAHERELNDKKTLFAQLQQNRAEIDNQIQTFESEFNKELVDHIKLKSALEHKDMKHQSALKSLEQAERAKEKNDEDIKEFERNLAQLIEEIDVEADEDIEQERVKEYQRLKNISKRQNTQDVQELDIMNQAHKADQNLLENETREKNEIVRSLREQTNIRDKHIKDLEKLDELIAERLTEQNQLKRIDEESRKTEESSKRTINELTEQFNRAMAELRNAESKATHESINKKKEIVLKKLKKEFPGVHDRLSSLVEPRQKKLHLAAGRVMASEMDSIVVDTGRTALRCVQFLDDNQLGREKFIPLDSIQAPPLKERLREAFGRIGVRLLYDELDFDKQYEKAVLYATKNALVCDSHDLAGDLAYGRVTDLLGPDQVYEERHNVVSSNGRYFQKNGVISAMSTEAAQRVKQFGKNKVSAHKERVEKIKEKLEEEKKKREAVPSDLSARLKGVTTRLGRMKSQREETLESLEQTEKLMEDLEGKLKNCSDGIEELRSKMQDREGKIKEIVDKMEEKENEVFEEFCRNVGVANAREFADNELKKHEEKMKRRNEINNQISRIEQQMQYQNSKKTQLTGNIERWQRTVKEEEDGLEAMREDEREMAKKIADKERELNNLKGDRDSLKGDFEEFDEKIALARKDLNQANKRLESIKKEIVEIHGRIYLKRFERHLALVRPKMDGVELPLAKGSMEDIDEKAGSQSTFNSFSTQSTDFSQTSVSSESTQAMFSREEKVVVDYSHLPVKYKEIDQAEVKDEMKRMEMEIEEYVEKFQELDTPNFRAKDKLNNANERLNEVRKELDDAKQKVKELRKAFDDVKEERLKRFKACFDHVCNEIDGIYKGLTGSQSSQAYLVAENSEEPYLGGLNYSCVAPGKRYQLMTYLSGGEKTVAAIALLFAIHSRMASPFFVLDEIDAALDGENVRKVTEYFRSKKNDVQIIQITLKESVGKRADVAVGVCPEPTERQLRSKAVLVDLGEYSN